METGEFKPSENNSIPGVVGGGFYFNEHCIVATVQYTLCKNHMVVCGCGILHYLTHTVLIEPGLLSANETKQQLHK